MTDSNSQKTFIDHLEELRKVIFRILFTVMLLMPAMFFFADDAIQFLVNHSCPNDFSLSYFSPMEPLFVKIKISLLAALFIGMPYIAYTIWKFIVPALYPNEKQSIKRLAFSSWFLFIAGILFCFYFIIPAMMRFSLGMQNSALKATIGLSNYIGLVGMLMLGFGVMFQLPIVIFFLVMSGIIKLSTLKKQRAIVLIIILTLAALLTPPDIFSQIMLALPTYMLFELSLICSAMALKARETSSDDHNNTPNEIVHNSLPLAIEPSQNDVSCQPSSADNHSADFHKYYRSHTVKRTLRSRSKSRKVTKKTTKRLK